MLIGSAFNRGGVSVVRRFEILKDLRSEGVERILRSGCLEDWAVSRRDEFNPGGRNPNAEWLERTQRLKPAAL